jgi:hypothetical protein
MKTLRVCLSSSLPPLTDRDRNYLYFTYDDLALYSGQNTLYENFVITHEIPEEQVEGMIYILDTDGSVHRKEDYQDLVIAEIEDSSQVEILQKAGTMFYVNSNYKYLDSQTFKNKDELETAICEYEEYINQQPLGMGEMGDISDMADDYARERELPFYED